MLRVGLLDETSFKDQIHASRMIQFDEEFQHKNPSTSFLFKMDFNGGFGIFSKSFEFMILKNEVFHVITLYILN